MHFLSQSIGLWSACGVVNTIELQNQVN